MEFVKENLTFTGEDSPMATLMLSVMGAFAEFERSLILERQRKGIAAAKARGVYTGRKHALTDTQSHQLRQRAAAGEKKAALAREFGISRETVYSYPNTEPALPADERAQAAVGGVSPAVVHTEEKASELGSPGMPMPTPAPVPPAVPAAARAPGRRAGSRVRQPKSRRERWLDPKAKVRELVTLTRDPDTGDHRVTDGDEYLGRIARQITATGRRGRWQALDPHNTVLRGGP